jgi:hypothetical protein
VETFSHGNGSIVATPLLQYWNKKRVGPHTDVNCWGAILALGCSVENAILSANKYGLNTQLKIPELEKMNLAQNSI